MNLCNLDILKLFLQINFLINEVRNKIIEFLESINLVKLRCEIFINDWFSWLSLIYLEKILK
jgi:hypothetical protein